MDFGGFIEPLSVMQKGDLPDRVKCIYYFLHSLTIKVCMDIYGNNDELTPKQLCKVVEAVIR